jgi:two-component system, cell cycle sensor histidine kinase and response regulator CckA
MIVPDYCIAAVDAVGAGALTAALLGLAIRSTRRLSGSGVALLASIITVMLADAVTNSLEWIHAGRYLDVITDYFGPLIPSLWMFMTQEALTRADRDQLRRGYDRLSAVHNIAVKLTGTTDVRLILDEVIASACRLFDTQYGVVLMPDGEGRFLESRTASGLTPDEAEHLRVRVGEGLAGRAFSEQRPQRSGHNLEGVAPMVAEAARRHQIRHIISVPLMVRDQAIGAVNIARAGPQPFTDDEVSLLETFCAYAAVAINNARLYDRLAESEAKYRILVENAQVAIIAVDPSRNVLFWNHGAERLYGWTADEIIGQHISRIYPPDAREVLNRDVLPILERFGAWSSEYPNIRKDGSPFTAFMNLARVFDSERNVVCTLGVITDVTELVELRQQLFQAQKMETIGRLSSGIAHDFNNLLTAILGFASLLTESLPKGGDDHDCAASIEHAAQRGTQLVRHLLTFSQKQPTRFEPVDLNHVIRETVEFIQRTFPKSLTIVPRLDPHLHMIRGDTTQMHQVLMNLAINARDAMPKGGTLTLATENFRLAEDDMLVNGLKAGPCVVLTVSDTGTGISPEDQAHLFEPFFTTKSRAGGTGLGLSSVYGIVMRHGGRITFSSQSGQGTTFRIVLPILQPATKSSDPAAGSPEPAEE